MSLFETFSINIDDLRKIVLEHWNLNVQDCLKASQNHTYIATSKDDENKKYIIRITPDPKHERIESIKVELKFLDYLNENGLPVCPSIPSSINGSSIVHHDDLIISAFEYAKGEPVVYTEWKWMTDKDQVVALGKWTAKLHLLSKQFIKENPNILNNVREWTQLHNKILSDVPVHDDDESLRNNPDHYGIIHGDINPSNYFWDSQIGLPCVFDWDQLQKSWYIFDLAQPIWAVVSLEKGGNPINFEPVPEANVKEFTEWLLEGYEGNGGIQVNRESLQRMVDIKKQLYKRFCKKALLELPEDSFMGKFCKFMSDWLEKEDN